MRPDCEHYWLSPFGIIYLATRDEKLVKLTFCSSLSSFLPKESNNKFMDHCVRWLEAYFSGLRPSSQDLSLNMEGTPFQMQCWMALRDVPYGKTVSYGGLASAVPLAGHKKYARAIGHAMARNPVWIILPCHRIVHSDGSLGGYGGGLKLKKMLLTHERNTMK